MSGGTHLSSGKGRELQIRGECAGTESVGYSVSYLLLLETVLVELIVVLYCNWI
jgi:hypothetical protein